MTVVINDAVKDAMFRAAKSALVKAYAPYSTTRVAAALLDAAGDIHVGVNVENASYGLTICAERNAIARAITDGERPFAAILLISNRGAIPPCGACRQVMQEFFRKDDPVFLADESGIKLEYKLADLLPHPFGPPKKK